MAALAFLRAPQNRAAAVKLIAEIDEIPEPIAAAELDGNIMKLSTDGEIKKEWMERSLEMAKLIGMTNLAPVEESTSRTFKPVRPAVTEVGSDAARPSHSGKRGGAYVSPPKRDARTAADPCSLALAILPALLALAGAWELLPRNGVINPLLLPPLGDVLDDAGRAARPPAGARGDRRHRAAR